MKTFIVYTLTLFTCITSCTEEVKPSRITYSRLLTGETSKTWRMVGFNIIEKENEKNSLSLSIDNYCEDSVDYNDNYYTFYADAERTLEISEGPEKCSNYPHEDYFFQDTWSIENATATITFPFLPLFGEFSVPYTLVDLTERRMIIQFYNREVNDRYIYRFILNPVNE